MDGRVKERQRIKKTSTWIMMRRGNIEYPSSAAIKKKRKKRKRYTNQGIGKEERRGIKNERRAILMPFLIHSKVASLSFSPVDWWSMAPNLSSFYVQWTERKKWRMETESKTSLWMDESPFDTFDTFLILLLNMKQTPKVLFLQLQGQEVEGWGKVSKVSRERYNMFDSPDLWPFIGHPIKKKRSGRKESFFDTFTFTIRPQTYS